jgi:hypothetical protein
MSDDTNHTPDPAEVVAHLYSDDDGAPEWQHFVTCLLLTKELAWNPRLLLGELIMIAFVCAYYYNMHSHQTPYIGRATRQKGMQCNELAKCVPQVC